MSFPGVSVLVLQRGETDLTERALEAVRRSSYGGAIELLVWDNDSPDGVGNVARCADVALVESSSNVGFGPANNELAARATGELVLFLNNDTILAPSCLPRLVDRLLSDTRIVAVTPQFRGFDGRLLELGGFVGDSGEAWQLLRGERAPRSLLERAFPAHYGSAACLLMRRGTFLEAGGFDDLFAPAYYEDSDLCLRLTQGEDRVMVEPRAVAYHLEGGTAGTDVLAGAKRHQLRNRGRFAARWSRRLQSLPPVSQGAALRHALCEGDRPLVLWLLPEFLKPDRSGGHARVYRQLEALTQSGVVVVVWSEHVGDHGSYAARLEELGIAWCGYQEPSRWLLADREGSSLRSLQELLQLDVWDTVVAWSADAAHRFGPLVREWAPRTPFVVDSAVLLYRQCERGLGVGATQMDDLVTEKAWELEAYAAADALITSSEADALAIRTELSGLEITSFDVGAYKPVAVSDGQLGGSLVFLGNFVHPPNMDAVAWWSEEIAPRIEELCGRRIPLRVIGAASELVSTEIDGGAELEIAGWVEDLGVEMSRARVLVVPLRYGAGTKDKISMGMRYGVPTVTTSIGAESMPEELRKALAVIDEADPFAAHVVRLMGEDAEWSRVARATRTAAQNAWDDQELVGSRFVRWFSQFTQETARRR